ncbi:MAG: fasciclin domain-containing protein, partial [Bacteroidota bacterium]
MLRFSTGWLAILCLAVFVYSGCEDDEGFDGGPFIGTITDIASGDPQFSTLTSALERTGLDDFLDVPNRTLTVFAPTDAAFQAAGIDLGTVSDDALADILRYHVLGSSVRSADIAAGTSSAATLNTTGPGGEALPLRLDLNGSDLALNRDINVTTFDVEAVNGVIHIIDNVLLPPSILDRARIDGRFGTLITALERTGLDATVSGEGDFTVFAPTDDAFQASGIDLGMVSDDDLRNLLLYHVVGSAIPAGSIAAGDNFVASLDTTGPGNSPLSLLVNNTGGNVQVNDSSDVVVADVFATNGVIHAVDAVLGRQSIV